MSEPETTTVRFTTFRYTGWRRTLRRLTLKPTEGPTYEFEAEIIPTNEHNFDLKPIGPTRKIQP